MRAHGRCGNEQQREGLQKIRYCEKTQRNQMKPVNKKSPGAFQRSGIWCRWRGSNPHDVTINGF